MATCNKKQAAAAVGIPSLTRFFPSNQQDDAVLDVDTAADSEMPLPVNRDDLDVITFSEEVDDGRDEHQFKVVANLDIEDDDGDYLDDEIEAEADHTVPSKMKNKRGIQQDFMTAIHDRLKIEVSGKTKGLEAATWILE